jgi:maltooligosyltrehalose trehalohydrolase
MPVHENAGSDSHTPVNFNWGYNPVQLFAVKSTYGKPQDLKRFVQACHDREISVVLDVVYNHLVQDNLLMKFAGFLGRASRTASSSMGTIAKVPASVHVQTTVVRKCGPTWMTMP